MEASSKSRRPDCRRVGCRRAARTGASAVPRPRTHRWEPAAGAVPQCYRPHAAGGDWETIVDTGGDVLRELDAQYGSASRTAPNSVTRPGPTSLPSRGVRTRRTRSGTGASTGCWPPSARTARSSSATQADVRGGARHRCCRHRRGRRRAPLWRPERVGSRRGRRDGAPNRRGRLIAGRPAGRHGRSGPERYRLTPGWRDGPTAVAGGNWFWRQSKNRKRCGPLRTSPDTRRRTRARRPATAGPRSGRSSRRRRCRRRRRPQARGRRCGPAPVRR